MLLVLGDGIHEDWDTNSKSTWNIGAIKLQHSLSTEAWSKVLTEKAFTWEVDFRLSLKRGPGVLRFIVTKCRTRLSDWAETAQLNWTERNWTGVLTCPFIWDINFCLFVLINFCNVSLFSVGLWFFLLLLFILCWRRLRGLCKLPDGRDWQWDKLYLVLVGRALLSKTLILLSADGSGSLPPC